MIGPQAVRTPHSNEHESIKTELILRVSHGHQLFRKNHLAAYYKLEEATSATSYAVSVKLHQKTKMEETLGLLCLTNKYAGNNKWEAKIKRPEQMLHTKQWMRQSNFTLKRFNAQHRNTFVSIQAFAKHITYQLPNEHSQVGYLLDAIQCNDAGLQATMASIKTDQAAKGMQNDFEAAASHLLPSSPLQMNRVDHARGKHGSADISDTSSEEANVPSFGTKKGTGSSGVPLQYHKKADYDLLEKGQKEELCEWRKGEREKG